MRTMTKIKVSLVLLAVLAVVTLWGGWPDFRDGVNEERDGANEEKDEIIVIASVIWQQKEEREDQRLYVNIKGELSYPFHAENEWESPFVEEGPVQVGGTVKIEGQTVNGPGLGITCTIRRADGRVIDVQQVIIPGVRATCTALVTP